MAKSTNRKGASLRMIQKGVARDAPATPHLSSQFAHVQLGLGQDVL
jgi:hypothetical protein